MTLAPLTSAFRSDVLAGKVAFITGGTSGINLGIARRFVQAGAKVTVLGRKPEKAQAAREELQALAASTKSGGDALDVIADVRKPEEMTAAFEKAHAKFGEIDTLICGAAGNFPAPALAMSPNGFKSVMDIDVLGTFHGCRLGFEHLKKPGASILNISAPQAAIPAIMQAHVCAAKAGVDMLTKALAMEWGALGVRVNALWPGPVDGTEGMERLASTPEIRAKMESVLPLGRFQQREEVAEMALFLSTDSARYVTGSIIAVDGGMSLVGFHAMMP